MREVHVEQIVLSVTCGYESCRAHYLVPRSNLCIWIIHYYRERDKKMNVEWIWYSRPHICIFGRGALCIDNFQNPPKAEIQQERTGTNKDLYRKTICGGSGTRFNRDDRRLPYSTHPLEWSCGRCGLFLQSATNHRPRACRTDSSWNVFQHNIGHDPMYGDYIYR